MKKHFSPIYAHVDPDGLAVVTEADISSLPMAVQKHLRFCGIVGRKEIRTVALKQKGLFRPKVGGKWVPMTAVQYINADAMGFIWKARASIARVTDQFVNGRGSLKVKLFGLIPVASVAGPEIDQGEALRFLTELIWLPTAFTKDYLTWNEKNHTSSDATISYNNQKATARFHFRESGELDKITADRYREISGRFSMDKWVISDLAYKSFSGITIPYKAHVSWELEDQVFCYDKLEITDVCFNGIF